MYEKMHFTYRMTILMRLCIINLKLTGKHHNTSTNTVEAGITTVQYPNVLKYLDA